MFTLFLFSLFFFSMVVLGMSVGVIFANKRIAGSCGGLAVYGPDGQPLSCGSCPREKREKCDNNKELVTE